MDRFHVSVCGTALVTANITKHQDVTAGVYCNLWILFYNYFYRHIFQKQVKRHNHKASFVRHLMNALRLSVSFAWACAEVRWNQDNSKIKSVDGNADIIFNLYQFYKTAVYGNTVWHQTKRFCAPNQDACWQKYYVHL